MSGAAPGVEGGSRALSALDRCTGKAVWVGAVMAGVCLNALVVMILAQVFSRNLLDLAFAFVLDVGGWLFVAMSFLAFGWTLREQAHIRMTAVTERLRPRVRIWLAVLVDLISLGFCTFFLVSIARNFAQTYRTGVTAPGALDLPVYPVWGLAMFGMILLMLQFAVDLLRGLQAIKRGQDRVIGAPSTGPQVGDL